MQHLGRFISVRVCGIIVFCFGFSVFNFRDHIYNAGLKHLRMLHWFFPLVGVFFPSELL